MSKEAMKLALEALQEVYWSSRSAKHDEAIASLRERLAQPDPVPYWHSEFLKHNTTSGQPAQQQEPVAWLITDEKINSLQVDSIQRLIDRARHAHITDIKLRINGQDEWYQADWLKHLIRATPPQRTWVGLTDEEKADLFEGTAPYYNETDYADAIEAKLKEKNT